MPDREAMNKYMAERRAELKERGICVDCQKARVSPPPAGQRPHVCCDTCLEARRSRWRANRRVIPLPFDGAFPV